jgi:hypothetical protein
MGCDIHLFVEKKKDDGSWDIVPAPPTKTSYRWVSPSSSVDGAWDTWEGEPRTLRGWFNGRNYALFGMLSDVRNGRGFAGMTTGYGFKPISDPLGVPDSASAEYKESVACYGEDGHSHSYILLADWAVYRDAANDLTTVWYGDKDTTPYSAHLEEFDEFIKELANYGTPDNLRLVFYFDN